MFAAPIGEAGRILSANKRFSRIFFYSLRSPVGGVQIAGPIVFTQPKGDKRIGKVQTTLCSASPTVIEIAY
jgi:hypothetical protein